MGVVTNAEYDAHYEGLMTCNDRFGPTAVFRFAPFAVIRLRRCIVQLGTGSCRGDDALKSGVCRLILPLSVSTIFYNRATA